MRYWVVPESAVLRGWNCDEVTVDTMERGG